MIPVRFEAVYPKHMAITRHRRHVVPRGVAGEREEIEVRPREIDRALKGAFRVADGVVIMEIAPKQQVLTASGRREELRGLAEACQGNRAETRGDKLPAR